MHEAVCDCGFVGGHGFNLYMSLVGRHIVYYASTYLSPLIEPSRTASASVSSGGGARKLSSPPTAVSDAAEVSMALRLRSGAVLV